MGFCENSDIRPRLLGAQAEGAAPIVLGKVVENPETEATAIRIGNPARWNQAVDALKESDGRILSVSDKEIFDAYHMVAQLEGVFCEPSSAAGIAGLRKAVQQGLVDVRGKVVATVLTGHGLKDPDSATKDFVAIKPIEPSIDSLLEQVNA
jgi:threonine synthase